MANSNSDLSDVRPDAGTAGNVSPQQLPMRGEKRIIPSPVSPSDLNTTFENAANSGGDLSHQQQFVSGFYNTGRTSLVQASDFNVVAAMSPFVDYVIVRLQNRGIGGNGKPDGSPAVYRFLINPTQVVVNRTTLDAQAFARGGWQIGVWGEDSLSISLTGKTAGQYFAFGLTDKFQPFTESYRNMEQLQAVFENNGYWFEGEQQAEGPLAANGPGFAQGADFARRIIKMHADVELIVGNFMWQGMFESLTLSQDANNPFYMSFQINFIAWKERFRKGSPYPDTKHNDVKRGHDYGAWKTTAMAVQQQTSIVGGRQGVTLTPNVIPPPPELPSSLVPMRQPVTLPPAVDAATAVNTYPNVDPTSNDHCVIAPALNPFTPQNFGTWNGVLSPLPYGNGGKQT